ncbi:unnamed protein product [Protopolystoma xenopodis]|uniref:Uncharacterized protein n=1 Tax=Protopolystoma xenopodis TaxID=117903 RepID=A0A448WX70_9PLAT|nr:unnamed protein product [Protopolystoma xenopodis]
MKSSLNSAVAESLANVTAYVEKACLCISNLRQQRDSLSAQLTSERAEGAQHLKACRRQFQIDHMRQLAELRRSLVREHFSELQRVVASIMGVHVPTWPSGNG